MINLEIYVTDNCPSCSRVIESARSLVKTNPNILLRVTNIYNTTKKVSIVPAVFLNEKLICYGEFKQDTILKTIRS